MKNNNKWYLILILSPKPRYTISQYKECRDIVFPIKIEKEFNGRDAESSARAEANRLNNQADRI